MDGGVTEFVAYSEDGGAAVVYDIAPLGNGAHVFRIEAIGMQGRRSKTIPFDLDAEPSSPLNMRLRIR